MNKKIALFVTAFAMLLCINGVKAKQTIIVDENLNKCVVDKYNKDNETEISYETGLTEDQLSTIKELSCVAKDIEDTTGIEKLTSLETLNLYGNKIQNIDLSKNVNLKSLDIQYNLIKLVDVRNNKQLSDLKISEDTVVIRTDSDLNQDMSSYDEEWKNFIESFNNFNEESKDIQFYTFSTEDTLKVITINEGNSYLTNFSYENGVVKYVLNSDFDALVEDNVVIDMVIKTYADTLDYDSLSIDELMQMKNLTLDENGIYYEENTFADGDKEIKLLVTFELDIKNGLKIDFVSLNGDASEDEIVEEETENPETGNYYAYTTLAILGIVGGVTYLVSRKRSKFPQA